MPLIILIATIQQQIQVDQGIHSTRQRTFQIARISGGLVYGTHGVTIEPEDNKNEEDSWSRTFPELIGEIIKRVESSDTRWPLRQSIVACGCVCKKWKEQPMCETKEKTMMCRSLKNDGHQPMWREQPMCETQMKECRIPKKNLDTVHAVNGCNGDTFVI